MARQAPLDLDRLAGPVTVDGIVDEAAWYDIEPLPLTMLYPSHGEPLTERTEIRVAYDDTHLYASLRAFDSAPGGIRALSWERDRWGDDDEFVLVLDTFRDRETARVFMVHPTGNRVDMQIFNDAEPGRGDWLNQDWNTFWEAEATISDDGWFAEMKIPFSSLPFAQPDVTDGGVVMGLRAYRWIPRKFENQIFPPTSPEDGANPYFRPSTAAPVRLRDVERRRPVYLTPYVLGGAGRAGGSGSDVEGEFEAGGDVKVVFSDNTVLDLTANTDFAQVESDELQVNLSRFSLFFPEKRPFFMERSGLFELNTGGSTRLFYSRRIGLRPDGRPARIYGGARLVGRSGPWEFGGLSLQVDGSDGSQTENAGVFRVRRSILNERSNVGLMTTHRYADDGNWNLAWGLDALIQLTRFDFLTVVWAQTFDDSRETALDAGRFRGRAERTRSQGFGYEAEIVWSGRRYEPGLGFLTARDFTQSTLEVQYAWVPGPDSPLRSHRPVLWNQTRRRNLDGRIEFSSWSAVWVAQLKSGWGGDVWVNTTFEDLPEPIILSDEARVPVGRYRSNTINVGGGTGPGNLLRLNWFASAGTFFDGRRYTLELTPTWNPVSRVEISPGYEVNDITFDDRNQTFSSHILRLRVRFAFDKHLSLQALAQASSMNETLLANARFRYNVREGTDLWIVYRDGIQRIDRISNGRVGSLGRTIQVKYTHTFGN